MATRDRTEYFLQYRARMRRQRPVPPVTSSAEGTELAALPAPVELTLPPAWYGAVTAIERDIQSIRERLRELRERHGKHLLPGFDDRVQEEHEIDALTSGITGAIHKAFNKVKQLLRDEPDSSEELRMKKNIQRSLAAQLQELSAAFRRDQKLYLQKLRGLETAAEDEEAGDGGGAELSPETVDLGFTQLQLNELTTRELQARQWERETENILKSIIALNEIFRDVSILVVEQGTILDRIDYNIEHAEVHMKKANEELRKAVNIAKSNKMKQCIILLFVLILVALAVFVVKLILKGTISLR